ncbi:MAG: hypothetical protein JWO47_69 [Candidatus Saccharibacteria bacterium]|nr:hypothetical protein [Candidatus Saccharibacteria bacterium]
MKDMKKYYIGLMVLGLLTFGLMVYVIVLGVQSSQDVKTEKSAQDIADKLNKYVENKQEIPSSLSAAGVKDAPKTISYSKISDEEYKFCVTYKAAKGYGSSDISSALTSAAMTRAYGSAYSGSSSSTYEESTLYIGYTHKKGEDCQKVKPYLSGYNSLIDNGSGSSTGIDEYCDPAGKYYSTYKQYCDPVTPAPKTTVQ